MTAYKIWDKLLIKTAFAIYLVKQALERIKLLERGLTHYLQHAVTGMLWRHFQPAAHMMLYQFSRITTVGLVYLFITRIVQNQVITHTAAYKTFLYFWVTPEDADSPNTLQLVARPTEGAGQDVLWSSSNPAVATVVGGKNGATVVSHAKGTAVITATATDTVTGAVCSDTAVVTVKNGYTFDYFEPTNTVETDTEYLIGYKNGNDVYLMMNYNPDPIGSNNYYYSYNSNYVAYGIKAVLDENGNVVGVDNSNYSDAQLINTEWIFRNNESYYMVESAYQSGYYLRVYSSSNYTDLYASSGTSYATNWQWDANNNRLSYYVSSSLTKYASYMATAGNYSNFFQAATSAASVQLYRHVSGTVIIDDDTYTVTFVDWDGTVLSVQEVEPGASAVAPAAPVREGYTFTGWDVDYTDVQSDLIAPHSPSGSMSSPA